ncbi:alanyl-tRNA editing protein [Metaplanococcus flavidus]|uniref:Alanyl-tRNA editing protein n=1 Tax=Metaplanococcus flavidus TaxID=569883 RepID=A0ABW3L653_9BACL
MTEKIYYNDTAVKEATANVIEHGADDKGNYVVLDRSCFYPEGGGQPADRGVIGEAEVLDVQTVDGEIRHYTSRPLEEAEYLAVVDWERRFDHMQQHTGQHLLSAVFEKEFGMTTKSFHLGTERVSIDLDVPGIQPDQIKRVEEQVNFFVQRQIPIETEWVTQEQAAGLPLRKKPAVEGDIRLVKIADIDINACGGTHLRNTAELGLVKIIRMEKAKGATRIYFLCGNRALNHFDLLQSVTDQLTKSLNAPAAQLPEAATAMLIDRKDKEKQLKKVGARLLELEADSLQPENNMLIKSFEGRPVKEVQQLAQLKTQKCPALYVLFMVPEELHLRFVCAKSKNSPGDMKQVLEKILKSDGGSVGGTENISQGSVSGNGNSEIYTISFQELIKEIT